MRKFHTSQLFQLVFSWKFYLFLGLTTIYFAFRMSFYPSTITQAEYILLSVSDISYLLYFFIPYSFVCLMQELFQRTNYITIRLQTKKMARAFDVLFLCKFWSIFLGAWFVAIALLAVLNYSFLSQFVTTDIFLIETNGVLFQSSFFAIFSNLFFLYSGFVLFSFLLLEIGDKFGKQAAIWVFIVLFILTMWGIKSNYLNSLGFFLMFNPAAYFHLPVLLDNLYVEGRTFVLRSLLLHIMPTIIT